MTLSAMGFASSPLILGIRYWLQMCRIHAWWIAAEVIEIESFWNRPDAILIGETRCLYDTRCEPRSGLKFAIASLCLGAHPQPASLRIIATTDLLPEPF